MTLYPGTTPAARPAIDLSPRSVLARRARAKLATVPLATRLADVAKGRRADPLAAVRPTSAPQLAAMEKSYRNTLACCGDLSQIGARISATWCGNRWCLACSRVRTARAWLRYVPHLDTWGHRHFATLTVPNVPADRLAPTLVTMRATLRRLTVAMRRTHRTPLVALLKVECTYNPARDDYHPHYHLIVQDGGTARKLRALWLDEWPTATLAAQDVRPADEGAVRELFKYFTKLSTGRKPMPAFALDTIFGAMRGLRVFQPIGFKAPVAPDVPDEDAPIEDGPGTPAPDPARGSALYRWNQTVADWIDDATGEVLSGYEPSDRFRSFAESLGENPQPPPR